MHFDPPRLDAKVIPSTHRDGFFFLAFEFPDFGTVEVAISPFSAGLHDPVFLRNSEGERVGGVRLRRETWLRAVERIHGAGPEERGAWFDLFELLAQGGTEQDAEFWVERALRGGVRAVVGELREFAERRERAVRAAVEWRRRAEMLYGEADSVPVLYVRRSSRDHRVVVRIGDGRFVVFRVWGGKVRCTEPISDEVSLYSAVLSRSRGSRKVWRSPSDGEIREHVREAIDVLERHGKKHVPHGVLGEILSTVPAELALA